MIRKRLNLTFLSLIIQHLTRYEIKSEIPRKKAAAIAHKKKKIAHKKKKHQRDMPAVQTDKEATEPEQEHTCDITEYHEEGGTTYNKTPKIAGKHCSHCKEQMRITFARPAHICKKTWHGWERDGEGGRSGRKGDCNRSYLCDICYRKLTVSEEGQGNAKSRRNKRRRVHAV